MANIKISALPASTTPLAGTEVLPIVKSGSTVKVSVANLTAGRAVATAGGSFTDNYTQGTAGKGINFTANTPVTGMTSQLLNWYEEGDFTPVIAGTTTAGTATYAIQIGKYTRIGNRVFINLTVSYSAGTGTGTLKITGLPFPSNSTANNLQTMNAYVANLTLSSLTICVPLIDAGKSEILINQNAVGGGGDSNAVYDAAALIIISGQYQI